MKQSGRRRRLLTPAPFMCFNWLNRTVNNDWRTEEEVLAWISAGYTGLPEILAFAPRG